MIGRSSSRGTIMAAVHTRTGVRRWRLPPGTLALDGTPGSPWLLVDPETRQAFDALTTAGVPPCPEPPSDRPLLGVKCVAVMKPSSFRSPRTINRMPGSPASRALALVQRASPHWTGRTAHAAPRRARPDPRPLDHHIAPAVPAAVSRRSDAGTRTIGEQRHSSITGPELILWTHEEKTTGTVGPLADLPPGAARWLALWRHRLAARSDTHGRGPWWSLFRTDSASAKWPRVVWADIGRSPRAAVVPAGDQTGPAE